MAGHVASDEEGAGEVGGDDAVPVGEADIQQRLSVLRTGVVDEDLDRPDFGFDGGDAGPDLVLVGDVERAGRDSVIPEPVGQYRRGLIR